MTYLELVQQLREDCEVSGTGPVTVLNQIGEYKRLAHLIARAWFDIQAIYQTWKFLRLPATWTSIDGQSGYTPLQCGIPAGTFGLWHPERRNVRGYLTATGTPGEFLIDRISWDAYRSYWQYGTARDLKQQPSQCAINDDDSIYFGPKPPSGYTFIADYYRSPVMMTLDADVPALPAKHSPLIIMFKAMINYGIHKGDAGLVSLGQAEYSERLGRLRLDQGPKFALPGAMA